jgi:hypothetical protein
VDALEGLIDTERQVRKEAENTLFFVRKDLQKREGELAEARHDLEYYRRNFPGHSIPRPVAATPAEQAQPTYEDGEGKPAKQLNAERLISSTPIKAAEQAQGEVANCGRPGPGCMESAQVAALAKRVDALTARLDRIAAPPPRPFVSEVKRHWDDPSVRDNFVDATLDDHEARLRDLEWRFKTTDPRAAGPGHAFVPGGGDFGKIVGGKLVACDGYGNNVCACGLLELDPIHAVPPIAGSAKP